MSRSAGEAGALYVDTLLQSRGPSPSNLGCQSSRRDRQTRRFHKPTLPRFTNSALPSWLAGLHGSVPACFRLLGSILSRFTPTQAKGMPAPFQARLACSRPCLCCAVRQPMPTWQQCLSHPAHVRSNLIQVRSQAHHSSCSNAIRGGMLVRGFGLVLP